MIPPVTMLVICKITSLSAFVASIYSLWTIMSGELPDTFLSDILMFVFFILASVISVMLVVGCHAFLPQNYDLNKRAFQVLRYATLLCVSSNWLLIPISLAVIHFYCLSFDVVKIENYLKYESDLIFLLVLWSFMLAGLTYREEFIFMMLLFPAGMMIMSLLNGNICGFLCVILLAVKLISGMCYPIEALETSSVPEITVIFREVYLTLLIICFMAGTTSKIINKNNDLLSQFTNPYWMVLYEYAFSAKK